ncbi:hypothetical protein M0R45_019996 [Rubus argutus]|uniref:Importin N-terminal domain-containing protein n=1 Tax=Rubus argutus TaxID=59490 RepID=A0AAW1XA87_RUBAR
MDLPGLAVILQAALSTNPDERKAAEQSLNQIQYTPQHLVRLLQIIVDGNCDMGVRQVASIHFKNFIAKNWSPHEPDEQHKISQPDKDVVRDHILVFVTQWPRLLDWVKHKLTRPTSLWSFVCFEDSSRNMSSNLMMRGHLLVQIPNPSLEVADLIKLICKIFWSSIYLEIPKQLFDPNVFNAWMMLFLNILERPVPVEGQPADPDLRKAWGWWKVKKWTTHILNRLYTRFGDLKLQIQKTDLTNLVLQYLSNSISKISMYNLLQPRLNVLLFEIVFPLMCFNDNDQKLWDEDPHEYVRKGYDIIEDLKIFIHSFNSLWKFSRGMMKLPWNTNPIDRKMVRFLLLEHFVTN